MDLLYSHEIIVINNIFVDIVKNPDNQKISDSSSTNAIVTSLIVIAICGVLVLGLLFYLRRVKRKKLINRTASPEIFFTQSSTYKMFWNLDIIFVRQILFGLLLYVNVCWSFIWVPIIVNSLVSLKYCGYVLEIKKRLLDIHGLD